MATSYRKTDIRHTTPEEREAIALVAERYGIPHACIAFKRNVATVYYVCRAAGVRWRITKKNTPIATRRRCAALYAKGKHTQRQLAAMFKVTEGRVSQWVQEAKR